MALLFGPTSAKHPQKLLKDAEDIKSHDKRKDLGGFSGSKSQVLCVCQDSRYKLRTLFVSLNNV